MHCGHCGTQTAGNLRGYTDERFSDIRDAVSDSYIFLRCQVCDEGNMFRVTAPFSLSFVLENRTAAFPTLVKQYEQWPRPQKPDVPDALPPPVHRAFLKAEELMADKHFGPAAMRYRKALEMAAKNIDPDASGSLYRRIEKLADEGRITEDLKNLATQTRIIGNADVHDDEDDEAAIKTDAQDTRHFTHFFMQYVFSLPAKIRARLPDEPEDENAADGETPAPNSAQS